MAQDNTKQAQRIAWFTTQWGAVFMMALEALETLEAERSSSGLNLPDFDTSYVLDERVQHLDGAELNGVLNTSIPAIRTFIDTNSHDTNLNKVRGGIKPGVNIYDF